MGMGPGRWSGFQGPAFLFEVAFNIRSKYIGIPKLLKKCHGREMCWFLVVFVQVAENNVSGMASIVEVCPSSARILSGNHKRMDPPKGEVCIEYVLF